MMKKIFSLFFVFVLLFSLFAVPVSASETEESDWDFSAEYPTAEPTGVTINVYNWGEYISTGTEGSLDVNAEFTRRTGIEVNYTTFDSNESLYSKLAGGGANYDVIIPSEYMIAKMISEDMLEKLDFSNIPNFEYIDEKFRDPAYDPGCTYSVPYTWGTVGLFYNTEHVTEEVTGWSSLWDEKYSGKILMFDNPRDAFAIAQARLGISFNTTDLNEWNEAAMLLKEQKPIVQAYVMDQIFDKMQGNEAALAPYYAGDAVNMMAENESLRFVIPEEGSNWFADAACIPAPSDSFDEERYLAAHMYINFLNEPNVAAENIEYIQYSTPNTAALALLDEETQNNPIIYPDDELLDSCQAYVNLSTETNMYMDTLWTDLMSAAPEYNEWAMPLFLAGCLAACVAITVGKKQYRRRKEQFSYDNYRKNIMP